MREQLSTKEEVAGVLADYFGLDVPASEIGSDTKPIDAGVQWERRLSHHTGKIIVITEHWSRREGATYEVTDD